MAIIGSKARTSEPFRLTLEMSSSIPSIAQLFYDTGSGYREIDSRTASVDGNGIDAFQELSFELPPATIRSLRFDPLTEAGAVALRNVAIRGPNDFALPIPVTGILAFNQILNRHESPGSVEFTTLPGASDPGLLITLPKPFRARHLEAILRARSILKSIGLWLLLVGLAYLVSRILPVGIGHSLQSHVRSVAGRLSSADFISFDAAAIWFYIFCGGCFLVAVSADLNGSSADVYNAVYGYGADQHLLVGTAQESRSDEWVFHTPDILNEALRPDRFAVDPSPLGSHSIALTGNLPLAHFTTIFRPQFWSFFVLPLQYAYSAYWQFKALLLVTGIFSLLLLLTGSTFWSITGALWYFFSPFTQWTYSWPSTLPEMTGLICLITVFFCYLLVGRNRAGLALAAIGLSSCAVNFALCAYLPHLIPLFWVAFILILCWGFAKRKVIFSREHAIPRIIAMSAALGVIAVCGALIYLDLQSAIAAVLHTAYPGQRHSGGLTLPALELLSHFFQWTESDKHFPPPFGNICEGAGFLWLAPVSLLCLSRSSFTPSRKACLIGLWIVFAGLLAWATLPVPVALGRPFGLDQTYGARMLPALGLANIAIVAVTMASFRQKRQLAANRLALRIGFETVAATAVFLLLLLLVNKVYANYFLRSDFVIAICFATVLTVLMLERQKLVFAVALIVPQALLFGFVNPIERGLDVITSSELFGFVRQHPGLKSGGWIVYSDSPVPSGLFTAVGCHTYTGLHYMPDVDHFALFASRGLDVQTFNRDGYLTAHVEDRGQKPSVTLISGGYIRWNISPSDSLLPQLGIKYAAFAQRPSDAIRAQLIPLNNSAVDKFWLYQLR